MTYARCRASVRAARPRSPDPHRIRRLAALCAAFALFVCASAVAAAEARENFFGDPFIQATQGIAACPAPEGPLMTRAEMHADEHARAERGTRCYLEGRCRLPNAYLYDSEIVPRVKKAILADGRFGDTSIWVQGQRRWVSLKGCVRRKGDMQALEQLVRRIDDVEAVIDELHVVAH